MVKAPALLLLSLALGGCAMAPQASLTPDPAFRSARYAWDGAGTDPNQPGAASGPARTAASERTKWQAQDDGIEAQQDAKVNRSLVICQGCLGAQPQAEDSRLAKAND